MARLYVQQTPQPTLWFRQQHDPLPPVHLCLDRNRLLDPCIIVLALFECRGFHKCYRPPRLVRVCDCHATYSHR